MTLTRIQRVALGLSGATAFGIGTFILTAPHAFYASYGIALGNNPSLMSELRAPGAALAAFGLVMLFGLMREAFSQASKVAALTVFLAFPAGRLAGLLVDGIPSTGILAALVLELAIAGFCLVAFRPRRTTVDSRQDTSPIAAQ